jgi:hypothetical protein
MSITMSDTDKLEIKIMNIIEEKLDKFGVAQNLRFDKLEKKIDGLDKVYATKEEVKSVKESMRMYKNGILFVAGAVCLYLVTYTLNLIYRI